MRSERNIGEALDAAAACLGRAGIEAPRFEAELLLARLLDTDRGGLRVRARDPLDADVAPRFARWVARRARREPLQHITGVQEFHGLELQIDRRALVPRPETEGVVDVALEIARRVAEGPRIADLGTGSGCIAIALAVREPRARLHALDRSAEALELARANARAHGVAERIEFREADLAAPPAAWHASMDLVVANPPYVAEGEWAALEPEVRVFDPREALVAGPTGLEAYPVVARSALELLRPGGALVAEVGFGQAQHVSRIVAEAGLEPLEVRADLRGIPRVLVARKGGPAS